MFSSYSEEHATTFTSSKRSRSLSEKDNEEMGREASKRQEQVVHRKQRHGVGGKGAWPRRERILLIRSEDRDSGLLWVQERVHHPL